MKEYEKALATYELGLQHDPNSEELKEGVRRCIEQIQKVGRPPLSSPFGNHERPSNTKNQHHLAALFEGPELVFRCTSCVAECCEGSLAVSRTMLLQV